MRAQGRNVYHKSRFSTRQFFLLSFRWLSVSTSLISKLILSPAPCWLVWCPSPFASSHSALTFADGLIHLGFCTPLHSSILRLRLLLPVEVEGEERTGGAEGNKSEERDWNSHQMTKQAAMLLLPDLISQEEWKKRKILGKDLAYFRFQELDALYVLFHSYSPFLLFLCSFSLSLSHTWLSKLDILKSPVRMCLRGIKDLLQGHRVLTVKLALLGRTCSSRTYILSPALSSLPSYYSLMGLPPVFIFLPCFEKKMLY